MCSDLALDISDWSCHQSQCTHLLVFAQVFEVRYHSHIFRLVDEAGTWPGDEYCAGRIGRSGIRKEFVKRYLPDLWIAIVQEAQELNTTGCVRGER